MATWGNHATMQTKAGAAEENTDWSKDRIQNEKVLNKVGDGFVCCNKQHVVPAELDTHTHTCVYITCNMNVCTNSKWQASLLSVNINSKYQRQQPIEECRS